MNLDSTRDPNADGILVFESLAVPAMVDIIAVGAANAATVVGLALRGYMEG